MGKTKINTEAINKLEFIKNKVEKYPDTWGSEVNANYVAKLYKKLITKDIDRVMRSVRESESS